jgi:hypothetical protein
MRLVVSTAHSAHLGLAAAAGACMHGWEGCAGIKRATKGKDEGVVGKAA